RQRRGPHAIARERALGRQLAIKQEVRNLFEAAVLGEIADVVSAVFEALAFRTDGTDRGPARDDAGEARRVAVPRHPKRSCFKPGQARSEEHTSELQSRENLVCRLLLEKKK